MKRIIQHDKTLNSTCNTSKAILRGNFIALNSYIKKSEGIQINDLTVQLKIQERQEQTEPKLNRCEATTSEQKLMKRNKENNKILNESKSCFQS